MTKPAVSNLPALDGKTEMLIDGLSQSEIESLEKEFENLCDLSFEKSSVQGNSVSEEGACNFLKADDGDTITAHGRSKFSMSHSNHTAKSAENGVTSHLKKHDKQEEVCEKHVKEGVSTFNESHDHGNATTSHERHSATRAERRRQYMKQNSPNRSTQTHSFDSTVKIDEAASGSISKRRIASSSDNLEASRSHQLSSTVEARRSKLNAPDKIDTPEPRPRMRLTRRRISRDAEDETAQPRLTSRRMSIDDSDKDKESDVKEVKLNRTELRSTRLSLRERPTSAVCTYPKNEQTSVITRSRNLGHEEPTKSKDESQADGRHYRRTHPQEVRISQSRKLTDSTDDEKNEERVRSRATTEPAPHQYRDARGALSPRGRSSATSRSLHTNPHREQNKQGGDERISHSRTISYRLTPEKDDSRAKVCRPGTSSSDSVKSPTQSNDEKYHGSRPTRTRDIGNIRTASTRKKSDSSDEERKALVSSMRRHLEELKQLRNTAAEKHSISDSSGDERNAIRLGRSERKPGEVRPVRTRADCSSENKKTNKEIAQRTTTATNTTSTLTEAKTRRNRVDKPTSEGIVIKAKSAVNATEVQPDKTKFKSTVAQEHETKGLVSWKPKSTSEPTRKTAVDSINDPPSFRTEIQTEPITNPNSTLPSSKTTEASVDIVDRELTGAKLEDMNDNPSRNVGQKKESESTPLRKSPPTQILDIPPTQILDIPPAAKKEDRLKSPIYEQVKAVVLSGADSTDSDRSDIVLPRRLPRTEITKFEPDASSSLSSFCVDYGTGRRSSVPKTEPKEEARRFSLRSGDEKMGQRKAIRRTASLRTAKDRSWIRDQVDGSSSRRDSFSPDAIYGSRNSFTSEEKIILRNIKRGSDDTTVDSVQSVIESVDAEIREVQQREGNKAGDDLTRLSMADKLKLFTDSPEEKPPQKVVRRQQRYKSHRFKTQPITLDEVEKAGKITPRPVSLVITDKESEKLQKVMSTRESSSEKELWKGSLIEVPKEDSIDFFANSNARPISIAVDSDAFDDVFLCSQDILNIRRRPKLARRAGKKSTNPIKALQNRDDLEKVYTEIKVVDVKKIQRQQIDEKTGYAEVALQGLASVENFNMVSLKKATEQKKSTDPYSSLMLCLVKGRHDVQVRLVEPRASSLCSGDCYVLITAEKIFCWLGKYGNIIEKAKAQEFANLIYKFKGMGFRGEKDVIVIDEVNAERKKDFWELLGGFDKYFYQETDDELYEFRLCEMNIVYQLDKVTLLPDPRWCGQPLKFEMLQDHTKVIVFDFGTELYVWNGPKCSFDDRKRGLKLAKQVWENGVEYKESPNPFQPFLEEGGSFKSPRPDWCIFGKINHNMETQLFKEKFCDWPESNKIITVKVEKKEEREVVELAPCDVSSMLSPNREPVTLLLEGTHVGRGRQWSDKMDDFVSKDFDIVTIKVTCWLVQEYDHHLMDVASYGQFHESDTYVVRWQYMVIPAVKTLKGGTSRQSLAGRERCAYFFWQGKNSTVNEKGASALMTVELDEERGPQVRVVQGQEPPAFTQLFDGHMIVHLGKRGFESGPWKLYILRNEIIYEAYLLEVPCLFSSLRSRSSFVLLSTDSGLLYVWHGAKSPQKTRECAMEVGKMLSSLTPSEVGVKLALDEPVEVVEGNERRRFFVAFKDIDTHTATLSKDLSFKNANAPNYKMSPRLFHLTSVSGIFESIEILNHCRSEFITPLPFTQEHLYDPCIQPALFLMDTGTRLYVWQGWWPDGFEESENVQTGSGRARFSKERKLTLETALIYCNRKEIPGEFILAGYESGMFTDLFPTWKVHVEAETNNREEFERFKGVFGIEELLSSYEEKTYTYQELLLKPEGIDPSRIEAYLSENEFEMVFRMTKDSFYQLQAWKQIAMRKAAGLF